MNISDNKQLVKLIALLDYGLSIVLILLWILLSLIMIISVEGESVSKIGGIGLMMVFTAIPALIFGLNGFVLNHIREEGSGEIKNKSLKDS